MDMGFIGSDFSMTFAGVGFIAGVGFAAGVAFIAGVPDAAGDAFGDGDGAAIAPFMTGVVAPATNCH